MNTDPPVEATETYGHDVELIEFTSPVFPPEAFPERVRRGRPTTLPSVTPPTSRSAMEAITYHIGDPHPPTDDSPGPTVPG